MRLPLQNDKKPIQEKAVWAKANFIEREKKIQLGNP